MNWHFETMFSNGKYGDGDNDIWIVFFSFFSGKIPEMRAFFLLLLLLLDNKTYAYGMYYSSIAPLLVTSNIQMNECLCDVCKQNEPNMCNTVISNDLRQTFLVFSHFT